jgi:glycosyltransferase involved in cell wall biosynthesis
VEASNDGAVPPSATHLVLIPSYNPGARVIETVREVRRAWAPVWVVVDGSTDGTRESLEAEAARDPGLEVLVLARNSGKGAAVLHGLREAHRRGFTHALAMDSDGQHPAHRIADFMARSIAHPRSVILGSPVFDSSVPPARLRGRKISNFFANLETLWAGVGDSLFGYRVYPVAPLVDVMERTRFMRHFDFDPEAAVRLVWAGCPPVNEPAECRYFSREDGGVSHFHYLRTNAVLTWMHVRLLAGFLVRLPWLVARRLRG